MKNFYPKIHEALAFKAESDPIHDMDINPEEYIKLKLGLKYGKSLPDSFASKPYYDATGTSQGSDDDYYEDNSFYGFKTIDNRLYIIGAWSEFEYENENYYILYPVDAFEKELNESIKHFTQNSDPVRDMGFGYKFWEDLQEKLNNMDEEDFRNEFLPKTSKFRIDIIYLIYETIDFILTHKLSPQEHQKAFLYGLKTEQTARWPSNYRDLRRAVEVMRNQFHLNVHVPGQPPLVEESLKITHFTEDETDPIQDMGIGGFSFETLSPGAVIRVNPNYQSYIALTQNGNGNFTSYHTGFKLEKHHYLLVIRIRDAGYGYKNIEFRKFHKEENMLNYRNKWLEYERQGKQGLLWGAPHMWGGSFNRMIVSKLQFNRRFIVTERGFENELT